VQQLAKLKKDLAEANKAGEGYKITQKLDKPLMNVAPENDTTLPWDKDPNVVERGKGRRLYTKCNRGDVVRSYVEESNFNKGEYVLVIQCGNGRKFVVAGQHHTPTYLMPYDQSPDIKKES